VLKPLSRGLLNAAKSPVLRQVAMAAAGGSAPGAAPADAPQLQYEQQIAQARGLVTQDPKRGAQVVKQWVSADE
jgi:flagellar M-ring protein FliF